MKNKRVKNLILGSVLLLSFLICFYPAKIEAGFPLLSKIKEGIKDALDIAAGLATSPFFLAIMVVFIILLAISDFFLWLSGVLLNWVISPNFFSFSYTGMDNPVIAAAFPKIQALAGIILFLVFVFVALAIALDIAGYATKKTFVRLIGVALLINFSPVICGFFVDAGNIFAYYFLKSAQEGIGDITGNLSTLGSQFFNMLKGIFKGVSGQIKYIVHIFVMVILNFATAFAFFLYTGIFLVRYFAIWVLVILSPLAFVSFIIPKTSLHPFHEGLTEDWLKQLIGWSFIGVTCAFFLWLAVFTFGSLGPMLKITTSPPFQKDHSLVLSENQPIIIAQGTQSGDSSAAPEDLNFVSQILPNFIIIIFLYLGFTYGLKTGAIGAGGVMGFIKGMGTAFATGAVAGGIAGVAGGFRKSWAGMREALKEKKYGAAGLELLKTLPRAGRAGILGAQRGLARAGEAALKPLPSEVQEEIVRATPLWVKRPFVTTEKEMEKHINETFEKAGVSGVEKIALNRALAKELRARAIEKLIERDKLRDEIIENEKIQSLLNKPEYSRLQREVLKLRPDLAPKFIKDHKTKSYWSTQEILNKITTTEVLRIREKALSTPKVFENLTLEQIDYLGQYGSRAQKMALKSNIVDPEKREEIREDLRKLYENPETEVDARRIQRNITKVREDPHFLGYSRSQT
jgi:hypothetical protein